MSDVLDDANLGKALSIDRLKAFRHEIREAVREVMVEHDAARENLGLEIDALRTQLKEKGDFEGLLRRAMDERDTALARMKSAREAEAVAQRERDADRLEFTALRERATKAEAAAHELHVELQDVRDENARDAAYTREPDGALTVPEARVIARVLKKHADEDGEDLMGVFLKVTGHQILDSHGIATLAEKIEVLLNDLVKPHAFVEDPGTKKLHANSICFQCGKILNDAVHNPVNIDFAEAEEAADRSVSSASPVSPGDQMIARFQRWSEADPSHKPVFDVAAGPIITSGVAPTHRLNVSPSDEFDHSANPNPRSAPYVAMTKNQLISEVLTLEERLAVAQHTARIASLNATGKEPDYLGHRITEDSGSDEALFDFQSDREHMSSFKKREGVASQRIATIVRPENTRWILDRLRAKYGDRLASMDVVEIGAGVGYLAVDIARSCRSVIAIEADPLFSQTFARKLYEEPGDAPSRGVGGKPTNLTWIFGTATVEMSKWVPKADLVIVVTGSDEVALKKLAYAFTKPHVNADRTTERGGDVCMPWQDWNGGKAVIDCSRDYVMAIPDSKAGAR